MCIYTWDNHFPPSFHLCMYENITPVCFLLETQLSYHFMMYNSTNQRADYWEEYDIMRELLNRTGSYNVEGLVETLRDIIEDDAWNPAEWYATLADELTREEKDMLKYIRFQHSSAVTLDDYEQEVDAYEEDRDYF